MFLDSKRKELFKLKRYKHVKPLKSLNLSIFINITFLKQFLNFFPEYGLRLYISDG